MSTENCFVDIFVDIFGGIFGSLFQRFFGDIPTEIIYSFVDIFGGYGVMWGD